MQVVMVALFSVEYGLRVFAHSDSFSMLKRFFKCKKKKNRFMISTHFFCDRSTSYYYRFHIDCTILYRNYC